MSSRTDRWGIPSHPCSATNSVEPDNTCDTPHDSESPDNLNSTFDQLFRPRAMHGRPAEQLRPGRYLTINPSLSDEIRDRVTWERLITLAAVNGWQPEPGVTHPIDDETLYDLAEIACSYLEDLAPPGFQFMRTWDGHYEVRADEPDLD